MPSGRQLKSYFHYFPVVSAEHRLDLQTPDGSVCSWVGSLNTAIDSALSCTHPCTCEIEVCVCVWGGVTMYLHYKEILGVARHFIKKFYYGFGLPVRSVWDSATYEGLETPTHRALFLSMRQTHGTL